MGFFRGQTAVRDLYGTGVGSEARTERDVLGNEAYRRVLDRARRCGISARRDPRRVRPPWWLRPSIVIGRFGVAWLVLCAMPLVVWLVRPGPRPPPYAIVAAGLFLLLAVGQAVVTRRSLRAGPSAVCQAMLAEGRCPSCGYTLAKIEPDPADRCTVCPECGGAWRPSRVPCRLCGAELGIAPPPGEYVRCWCCRTLTRQEDPGPVAE